MINAKNLSKSYLGEPVLTNIDFTINQNRKIALVGRNGCGKTTLFKLINGLEEPDTGSLRVQNETLGYINQELTFKEELVGEFLEKRLQSKEQRYQIDILISQTKFRNFDEYQNINTLSEGQKLKLQLIGILLTGPTTIFIDEPTNHLDIEGIMWLEKYIKSLDKAVVMISHDRSFLNHTTDEIWEIEKGKLHKFTGNYDNYQIEKLKLIDKWDQEFSLFVKKKAQMEKLLANARKIKDGKSRGRAVGAAKKRIEREVTQQAKERYENKKMKKVDFTTQVRPGKLMVKTSKLSKKYGNNQVFADLDFEIRGNEKVWLFGPNGVGKTTLVKMIMGEEKPSQGEVVTGANVSIGYFAQKQAHFDTNLSVLEAFIKEAQCPYGKAFGVLKKFLFTGDIVHKLIRYISPGERARLAFAIFAHRDYDLLVLDEPTNHLDIETKIVIEKSLKDYEGALLLVSHDRYFVQRCGVNRILNLKEGRLTYQP